MYIAGRESRLESKTGVNPYSPAWNLKILRRYYNISCESTNVRDAVGIPTFKIRKIEKKKHGVKVDME